jgi:membrane protease YdiL (CAAX protease family)
VLWILFAAVLGIVFLWEKQPLSTLWLKPLEWQSVAWAVVLVLASNLVIFPATEWIRNAVALPGYELGMEKTIAMPVWFRIVAVVTAGIVEETLFRGYAVTRLLRLTGSVWLAGVVSVAVFASLHLPYWGTGPVLAFFLGGLVTTAFFIWRRDLLAMIIAHIVIDAWAFMVTPLYSTWWK